MQRRQWLARAGALGLIGCATGQAAAQAATGRVVLGFAPGGSVDALARMTADALGANSGRTFVVENRTGAGGRLALDLVKAAPPDGDTLLVAPQGPMTLFSHVFKKQLKYDPARDFTPITRLAVGDFALTVGPLSGAKDLASFRNWLKTAGAKATYGSPGAGTLPHFIGVSMAQKFGIEMTHVPYPGSAKSMIDLAGGNVASTLSPVTEALELHKAGKVRIVATSGAVRSPFTPDVPTFKEQGIELEVPLWFAVYGPAGIPAATVDRLRGAIDRALATPEAAERLAKLGLAAAPLAPAQMEALRQRESAMWGPIVAASGFTPND